MFQARGAAGRLLAGYAEVARLAAWDATTGETLGGATRIQAEIVGDPHPVLIRCRPLTVALSFERCEWRWTLDSLELQDGRLYGRAMGQPVIATKG
jgi:hypothetical protein